MMETLEMIFQHILIIQIIIHVSNTKSPDSICDIKKPFERSDQSCGDFNDICVKKDDLMCNNFQAACQQCPPTNYTVSVLLHLKNQIDLSNQRTATLKGQTDKSQKKIQKLTDLLTGFVVIFILGSMIIMVLIFIVKYGSIVSYFKFRRKKKSHDDDQGLHDPLLDSSKESESNYKNFEMLVQAINKLVNQKEYSALESEYSALKSAITYKLRFQIGNQFDETELFVSKFDNVIKLKKSICDRNMNMKDYKRMIMKYKGVAIDNNQFLLSCIDSTNIYPIFCEFDDNVDVDAMIVIKLKCDNIYPEMLQIGKYQTIKQLKIIISELKKTNDEDLLIFYKSNQLNDVDKSIDYYKIEDNDWINVVNKSQELQNISMKSIFNAKETISIEISKFETVSSIIDKSIQEIQDKMATNHFAVFLNKKLLENEKFIYEYNIDSKSLVEFCYFKSLNEIENINEPIFHDHLKIFKARNKISKRPLLIKAYTKNFMEMEHNGDLSKILRDDLKIFQITKSHPRFIQLINIYMDDNWVYLGLNISREVTLKSFMSSLDRNEITIYDKSKWANQILEGLKHLHNHNIILKDMNPMDIWIDGNHDVKLPSFNMTEYLDCHPVDISEYKHGVWAYIAPEILEGRHYDASADVWSLGVVMIDIIKHGQLFQGLKSTEIVKIIKESHTIEYDKSNKPAFLINFIDCCVKRDPKERSTIDQLMKHEFIEKYL